MATQTHEDEATKDNEELLRERERADRAEAELAALRAGQPERRIVLDEEVTSAGGGEEELRKDTMMAHLMDSLAAGKDIGHYGRLVFAMVARHFMPHEEVLAWLTKDPDFNDEKAEAMLVQVEQRGYNPPKRERILEWQREQEFPILPDKDDPDCGNLYRSLKFPDAVYKHIEEYQVQKAHSEE